MVFLITIILGLTLRLQRPVHPNIILITVDALRADHLGCYGYERNTSPNIDKLAKEGVVFLKCFATSSNTIWSSVGLFTGKYLETDKLDFFWEDFLDKKFTTLAEHLKSLNYYTAAFVTNHNYRKENGFAQGFDYYKNYREYADAKKITSDTLNFLNDRQSSKPLFIWIHYIEPHAPYSFRKEYFKDFENDTLYKENDKILELKPDNIESKNDPYYIWSSNGYIPPAVFHKDKFNLNYYIACYDTEIAYTDSHIGRLLNNKNIKDNTLIVLTADHGEILGEGNLYFTRGANIYDTLLHIPLIIKDNRDFKGEKRISTVVSSVDIVPTILSRINHNWYFFNKYKFDGKDLKGIMRGSERKRKYIYSYFPSARSIRDVKKNIKYILNTNGKEELYFLPDEYNNRIKDESSKVIYIKEELRRNLKTWLKHYPIRSDINSKKIFLDEQGKDSLRSLGYLQ